MQHNDPPGRIYDQNFRYFLQVRRNHRPLFDFDYSSVPFRLRGRRYGCRADSPSAPVLTAISVSPSKASVAVGATEQFQATAKIRTAMSCRSDFHLFQFRQCSHVDSTGLATGLSVGTATITASAKGKLIGFLAVLAGPVAPSVLTQISVSPSTASIQVGQQQTYTAVGYDQFNNAMNGLAFTWASDASNAIVILNGNVATGVAQVRYTSLLRLRVSTAFRRPSPCCRRRPCLRPSW